MTTKKQPVQWTDKEDKFIIDNYLQGKSKEYIQGVLVDSKVNPSGLSRIKSSTTNRIKSLYKKGLLDSTKIIGYVKPSDPIAIKQLEANENDLKKVAETKDGKMTSKKIGEMFNDLKTRMSDMENKLYKILEKLDIKK